MSLNSYVFKYAPADFLTVLCDLINALILHGHCHGCQEPFFLAEIG